MKCNLQRCLKKAKRHYEFHRQNLWLSFLLSALGLSIIYAFNIYPALFTYDKVGDYAFSVGSSLILLGAFSVLYEWQTRKSFEEMLAAINPNIGSGVTVYRSHSEAIPREEAIKDYLRGKEVFRLSSSTADHYVEKRSPPNLALLKKIEAGCTLKVLLHLPIFQGDAGVVAGRHGKKPNRIILKQRELLEDYKKLIESAPTDKVIIKFCFRPLHVNFFMLGNNRMFSSLIPNGPNSGISTPCFEIFPTGDGDDSLFFQFQQEFDEIFKDGALAYDVVAPLLQNYDGDLAELQKQVSEKLKHTYPVDTPA